MAFTGQVLRAPLIAPSNSPNTGEPTTGVVRDVRPVPQVYFSAADAPSFVDAAADQYRTALLDAPGTAPTEYIVWAANSSQLALVNDPTWWTEEGTGSIPPGDLTVTDLTPVPPGPGDLPPVHYGTFLDGASRLVVSDNGCRSISNIIAVVVARGDVDDYDDDGWVDENDPSLGREGTNPYLVLMITATDQVPDAGLVDLANVLTSGGADALTALGGGLSQERGDRIVTVHYTVAASRFWWTRNDRYETRFGWNSTTRRWEPYRGSAPQNLGQLLFDQVYQLAPKLKNLPLNAYLPGDSLVPDSYSMIRLGPDPSYTSTAVDRIRVVPDSDTESAFDFTRDPSSNAVVGQTNGKLQFNPSYVEQHAGKTVWYVYKGFSSTASGVVGKLIDALTAPLFVAPIPGPTDHPFIKLGSRNPLSPILVATDTLLEAAATPAEGEVIVSLSTGRLRFSPYDTWKADPASPYFSKFYLGEDVIYDGVALNAVPQPTKTAVQLLDQNGNPATAQASALYIPDYVALPGLGVSGILDTPDGTGAFPADPGTPACIRPGGDNTGDDALGRIRQVSDGVSEAFLFSRAGAVVALRIVDREDDLPSASYKVAQGVAYVAKERGTHGSRVVLSAADKTLFGSEDMYFLQAALIPSTYTTEAQLISRGRDIFRFTGDETFYVVIDGVASTWTPTALILANPTATYFTPDQVATDIDGVLGAGSAYELNGRIVLTGTNQVEIGWGTGGVKDLTGAAALGFLPGWLAIAGQPNWNPDSGVTLGLYRSPVNLNRQAGTADFQYRQRLTDTLLVDGIQGTPFVFLDQVPLQDIAGYDDGVFFNLTTTITQGEVTTVVNKPLEHYVDVVYRFGQRRFDWEERDLIETELETATTTVSLGHSGVVPESLLGAPDIGGGFYVSPDGSANVFQVQDTDYVLPQDGSTGTAVLVQRYGARITYGANGSITAGSTSFTDPDADFSLVTPGCRLKLTSSEDAGSYIVQTVAGQTLTVTQAFINGSTRKVTWEVYSGYPDSVYDPALVADQSYKEFNHLQSEPFAIRMLSFLGLVTGSTQLTASVQGAVQSGRTVSLRFGLAHALSGNTATLTPLGQTVLGPVANNTLVVPTAAPRFTTGSFSVKIGTTKYVPLGVASFSPNPVGVEYLLSTGMLKFNSTLLTDYASAKVTYVEEFLPAASLAEGQAEFDPNSGAINLSAADLANHSGEKVYFVEQLITEAKKDVSVSPMSGTFSPNVPVTAGTAVEVQYWAANLEGRKVGNQITEFIPVFVRDELALRTQPNTYLFNTASQYTVDQAIEPIVYIGPTMQNFGSLDFVVDYPTNLNGQGRITFVNKVVADYLPVTVTYSVYEAIGGERAFEASQKSIYRPPFFITAGQDRFGLWGDRTSEFVPGQMLRIGAECFYVRSLQYYAAQDITSVGIFPPTLAEVGSRAPGNDVLTLITAGPITTVVDPDGLLPVPTAAPAGFMSVLDTTVFPFEPASRGSKTLVFRGNLTQFAVAGHILEIGGYPFTIASSELNQDGSRTQVTLTAGLPAGFVCAPNVTVKLSYRPVYPPNAQDFLGVGPVLDSEPYELVLFPTSGPGTTLAPKVDYELDFNSGRVKLLEPMQAPLGTGEKLLLSFTKIRSLQPVLQDGVIAVPRISADFLFNTLPSVQNGLLGGQVTATYTFSSPDTFYFRALKLNSYMGEAAQEAVNEILAKQPAGGPVTPSRNPANWNQGRVGLMGERKNLLDKDRAAREFLGFYNDVVVGHEQILETISGGFIGDRDGKFRFWRGTGSAFPKPGFEDSISGLLTTRNVWSDVMNDQNPDLAIYVQAGDWIVTPESAEVTDGTLDGALVTPDQLKALQNLQGMLVKNDVDDVVLVRLGKSTTSSTAVYPFFKLRAKGSFKQMGVQHQFSRLFPTVTEAFFRTAPGAGADEATNNPGVYTAGRMIDGELRVTAGSQIGQLANPVVGDLTLVGSSELHKRMARARIWGYYPDGLPAGIFDGGGSPPIAKPCIIVSAVPLAQMPVNPDTGYPDDAQLLSQGGALPDASTGDPELALPGFVQYDQLCWGQPDGKLYNAFSPVGIEYLGLFVDEVLYGCVITFAAVDGAPPPIFAAVTDPDYVLVGTGAAAGVRADDFPIVQGDTLFVVPRVSAILGGTLPDPPTLAALEDAAANNGSFRVGFDVKVTSDGEVIDATLPSSADPAPLPLKELLGQSPPQPLTCLEGEINFTYTGQNPLTIPALFGQTQDDSGDYQIPYMLVGNTELTRFDQASVGLTDVFDVDVFGGAQYPDEIVGNDGQVSDVALTPPATLLTAQDVLPVTHGSTEPGVLDVQPYDLLFVQTAPGDGPFTTGGGPVQGSQGILTVGARSSDPLTFASQLEPPRFVTQTKAPVGGLSNLTGDDVGYLLTNAMVFTEGPYPDQPQAGPPPNGVVVIEDTLNNQTILDFGTTTVTLNDGQTVATGNFNDLITPLLLGNKLTIRLIARKDLDITDGPAGVSPLPSLTGGVEAYRIEIDGPTVFGYDYQGNPAMGGPFIGATFGTHTLALPVVQNRQIHIPRLGLFDWAAPGPRNQWFLPHTLAGGVYTLLYGFEWVFDLDVADSKTAWVDEDRLTFHEVCDLSFARARGDTHPLSGRSLETQLTVLSVYVGHTAATDNQSAINQYANGKPVVPFTFVPRDTAGVVGYWYDRVPGVTEHANLKVMGWEGYGNTPITTTTSATFSAVPSSFATKTDLILMGDGKTGSRWNSTITQPEKWDNRVAEVNAGLGAVDHVVPGDLLVIKKASNAVREATVHAGTYIIRHAVDATAGVPYRRTTPVTTAGDGIGWCPVSFPRVVSFDDIGGTLILTDPAQTRGGDTVGAYRTGFTTAYLLNPRVYIIRNVAGLASTDEATWRQSVISARYTNISIPGPGIETHFTVDSYRDAFGTALSAAQFAALIGGRNYPVSGMTVLPVNVSGAEYGLPNNNCVGYDSDSDVPVPVVNHAVYGFRWVRFESPTGGTDLDFDGDAVAPALSIGKAVAPNTLVPEVDATLVESYQFVDDPETPVYPWVVHSLALNGVTTSTWQSLNVPPAGWGAGGPALYVSCLLPSTVLRLENPAAVGPADTEGFYAQGGVFLEPSCPRTCLDLAADHAHVVDAAHSLADPDPFPVPPGFGDWDRELGMRDIKAYDLAGVALADPDEVIFEVRRIRRWHTNQLNNTELRPLQLAYEIRRGRITSYSVDNRQRGMVTALSFTMDWETTKPATAPKAPDVWNDQGVYTGTNLGTFDDPDVNIHAGDMFRLLDENGDLVEELEIQAVLAGSRIRLVPPGLQTNVALLPGMRFEVYLRQAPVPHEQSYEQLVALMTDRVVCRTDAAWSGVNADKGGYVPEVGAAPGGPAYASVVNKLYDDLEAPGGTLTFSARGVQKGDIVIVDPAGTIPQDNGLPAAPEKGVRPIGDEGVFERGAPTYVAGNPSVLDDNRGFYRVLQVVNTPTPYLLVQPLNDFAGSGTSPVVFDSGDATRAYAVYPTVHDSTLKQAPYIDPGDHLEGQMDLRPTKVRDAVTRSFKLNGGHSMRPFSYRVIRPSALFSDEAIDLILMGRERMLSLIELLRRVVMDKSSTYFIFQRDEHCAELGDTTDPELGLGVLSNDYIEAVLGRVDQVPFANNESCLSFLDRRFWIFDQRLDSLTWDGALGMRLIVPGVDTPYTAYSDTTGGGDQVRPVLPERINEVLDSTDRFRAIRYVWLAYRTHKLLGTLSSIARYDAELPERQAEQQANLLLQQSVEKGT